MARINTRDSYVALDDVDGALYILSQKMNNVTLSWTSESPEVTSFGEETRQRLSDGLTDWEVNLEGFSSADSDGILGDLFSGSTVLVFTPGGTTSGSIIYSCSGILDDYSLVSDVAGATRITAHLVACRNEPTRYLLRDTFGSDLAVGAVNGSYATDGINVRTVVNTADGSLSIAGGLLLIEPRGTPAWGDPGIWYPAQTRAAGKILFGKLLKGGVNELMFGWDTNRSGTLNGHALMTTGTALSVWDGVGSPNIAVGLIANATQYQLAIVLRAAGAFYFIKGGLFTQWTLLFMTSVLTTATLYPGLAGEDATGVQLDDVMISATLWLPVPIASDSFTRDNGALGSTDGLGHAEANGGSGLAWTEDTWTIATNKAIGTPTLGAELNSGTLTIGTWYSITATQTDYFYVGCAIGDTFRAAAATALDVNNKVKAITLSSTMASVSCGTASVKVRCTVVALTTGTRAGVVGRLDSASSPANFVIAYMDGANVTIDECVAGTYAQLGTAVKAFTASDTLELDLRTTGWRCYHVTAANAHTLIGSGTTNVTTGNLSGIFSTFASNTFSAATVYAKSNESQYVALDQLAV